MAEFATDEQVQEEVIKCYHMIIEVLKEYCELHPDYYSLVALWIIGTYCHDSFSTFPFLFINAMRGSGKTRLLKLIAAMSKDADIQANISEAVLFRTAKGRTIVLDEFEHIGSKEKGTLRELLNAAYKKGLKVKRMKRHKTIMGEEQVVEEFDLYTPICMANIWGMDEVLGDRCVTMTLEKSSDKRITKKLEDFDNYTTIQDIKRTLYTIQCSLCSVVTKKNLTSDWNVYVNNNYTTTHTTLTTLTALTTLTPQQDAIFKEIDEVGIDGRHLEIFFPIFILSNLISNETFCNTLRIAKGMVDDRKSDEHLESRDVMLYNLIAEAPIEWYDSFVSVHDITAKFREFVHEEVNEENWLNTKWVGRALRRLILILDKRRINKGVEVRLNIPKAKEKSMIFMKEEVAQCGA